MDQSEYAQIDRTAYWQRRHQVWVESPDLDNLKAKDRWFDERFAHILPLPSEPVRGVVLDLGCGCGIYSPALSRRFKTYVGVDTSASAIRFAISHFKESAAAFAHLTDRDATKIFGSVCFDCVVSITVLQHMTIDERLATIEGIKRILKPGGLYVGLEQQDGHAADMPTWSNEEWIEAWKPIEIKHDIPAEHPEWAADWVWSGVKP